MCIDLVTGKPIRFGKYMDSIGSLEDAMEHCFRYDSRCMIVELYGIVRNSIEKEPQ